MREVEISKFSTSPIRIGLAPLRKLCHGLPGLMRSLMHLQFNGKNTALVTRRRRLNSFKVRQRHLQQLTELRRFRNAIYFFIVSSLCRMWCNGNIRDCGSRVEGSIPSDLPIWGVSLMEEQVVAAHQVSVQICYSPPQLRRAGVFFLQGDEYVSAFTCTTLVFSPGYTSG